MMDEGSVEPDGIGIDQQLGRIEAVALCGIERAVGAKAVACPRPGACDEAAMNIIAAASGQRQARDLAVATLVEDADDDSLGIAGYHGEVDAVLVDRRAKRRGPTGRNRES